MLKAINDSDFYNISTHKKYGVPEESYPIIYLKVGSKSMSVGKWDSETNAQFDNLHRILKSIGEKHKYYKPTYTGINDQLWSPDTYPTVKDLIKQARKH